ncbi:TIM-barrel domain-containing protein [Pseudocnuella soli]|uniref:TIM-barrel domain-containing protein n=1 Tax=Pseudocnuella soli TaxID=2502779 RepID=UPI00104F849F|nr:TIM-barrel domain-containing protein [Pseudocnuella soli]
MRFNTQGSLFLLIAFLLLNVLRASSQQFVAKAKDDSVAIVSARKVNATTVEIQLSNGQKIILDFYGNHIFRLFQDADTGSLRDPEAKPPARILVDEPRTKVSKLVVGNSANEVKIATGAISVLIDKRSSRLRIFNRQKKLVAETLAPVQVGRKGATLKLTEGQHEYFYGGGVQNGRFSHKGKAIAIENQNSWTDGGVASPTPFYWSTNGYGLLWHTFKKGKYDFGAAEKGVVHLHHDANYLDVFFMINERPAALLNDFFQLTGKPVLLPKFAFYEGHLNAYNRDYWKEDSIGILFENGRRYKESQRENGGVRESLNGEQNNYPFSARAVVDRYKAHDLPLGWILPNDGYGAGYGQTGTLDSNILNLQSFGNYARKQGVQIGLWTQSDLHPKDGISALLQRDIVKEVGVAQVRVLKTDVAWVGPGYSFGLNGVADVANTMRRHGNNARPFIITLDGWAGTQRYAGVWTGDQTGGVWEYIRFHIPTYIGSGLAGQPNIGSDMDGIFGGKNPVVLARDFQWKTFTPMQLNMDGWGSNEKYPHVLGEPYTSINRTYLKLKSMLLPYEYSIAREAVSGLPQIRPMFLYDANSYTLGKATQYQYLYGPNFLVAPVYQPTKIDSADNDIRNGIYLPKGTWIDYFTGQVYAGGSILNHYAAPLWKLPLFVKSGAIIPITNANNNVSEIDNGLRIYEVYPDGNSSFTEYDDDGLTEEYKEGKGVTTLIRSSVVANRAIITVHRAKGDFSGFVKDKITAFRINVTQPPASVSVSVGSRQVVLKKATSKESYVAGTNVYFYEAAPSLNNFATTGSAFEQVAITKNPQLLVRVAATDITQKDIRLTVAGFRFAPADHLRTKTGAVQAPANVQVVDTYRQAYTLRPSWSAVAAADFYEILFNGQVYTNIRDTSFLFEDLEPETNYAFQLRSVNKSGHSAWTKFAATTGKNPLQFAIKGIVAESTAPAQGGSGIEQLFDFDEGNIWHTAWSKKAVPFELVIDLRSVNQLDKFRYLPRDRGNGFLLRGTVWHSMDKNEWKEAGAFRWERNGDTKEFVFTGAPTARCIRLSVTEGIGDFGSGRELYVFKIAGSASLIPGDINNDGKVDQADLTAYINYTGLKRSDSDFEGYISKGDVNHNGLIDAFDIAHVATRLDGGVNAKRRDSIGGTVKLAMDARTYNDGEIIEITAHGIGLRAVNALSFTLPYNEQELEFVGIVPTGMQQMENLTNNRLHTDGKRVLYPTFVNIGDQPALQGNVQLFVIRFKAKGQVKLTLETRGGMLVDKKMNAVSF